MIARSGRIEVVIDELVLHGFDPCHGEAIGEALRAELADGLEGWRPAAGINVASLEGGSFAVRAAAPPAVIGRRLAGQIQQALQGGTRHTIAPGAGA